MTHKNPPATLTELLEEGDPSSAAIRTPDGATVTYDSLRRQVHDLAGQLRGFGIERDDRVAIVLPNGLETILSFLAVSTVATAAPLNPAYKADEFRFYMEDTNARALITHSQGSEEVRKAAPPGALWISIDLESNGEARFSIAGESKGSHRHEAPDPDDIALVLHTSGTTSRPKRVPLTHANLAKSVRNVVDTYQLGPEDASLCVMPLFHVHGLVASTLATLLSGGTVIVPPRFNALNFWRLVEEYGVTWFSAVPTIHQALLNRARRRGRTADIPAVHEGLRFIRSCSSPLPASVMIEMEDRFGVPVLEAYGMTEAAHQMSSNPLPPGKRVPGSVGPGTGVSVAIMDEDGALQNTGDTGEVVIKGTNVINGYEDNPQANADSFTNGWFRTGDEGLLDSDGYLKLVGRRKELINRGGEKVSPVEIDEVLLTHPSVVEVVAFGIPHPILGEEPSAAVVLSEPTTTKSQLIEHCRRHLAQFKCPRRIHIVDSIPRTATGKVQRRLVAATFTGTSADG